MNILVLPWNLFTIRISSKFKQASNQCEMIHRADLRIQIRINRNWYEFNKRYECENPAFH